MRWITGERSVTCVRETSSTCRAERPASGVRSLTGVPATLNVCRAGRPASGARSLILVSSTEASSGQEGSGGASSLILRVPRAERLQGRQAGHGLGG